MNKARKHAHIQARRRQFEAEQVHSTDYLEQDIAYITEYLNNGGANDKQDEEVWQVLQEEVSDKEILSDDVSNGVPASLQGCTFVGGILERARRRNRTQDSSYAVGHPVRRVARFYVVVSAVYRIGPDLFNFYAKAVSL